MTASTGKGLNSIVPEKSSPKLSGFVELCGLT